MIEFDEEKPDEKKPKKIDEQKPKKKKKRKSPKTKGKGKPATWHSSAEKSKVAKGQVRGEGSIFLGKRQFLMKIDYNFEEQRYQLKMKSGDGTVDEIQDCGGIPRVLFTLEKTIKKWRGQLV